MKLWLLRHGEAEPSRGRDAERALTEHGRQQVQVMTRHLAGQPLTQVLCSPYARARQTTSLVLDALEMEQSPLVVPWLTPDEQVQTVVRMLDGQASGDILLVSHQPLLGLLGSWLCEGNLTRPLPLGTASLACLEGDFIAAGLMSLVALYHPQTGF